jgi:hypothetical protein
MDANGMTHPQVSHVMGHLSLALVIIGVLILASFLLVKYVFFKNITQHHEH